MAEARILSLRLPALAVVHEGLSAEPTLNAILKRQVERQIQWYHIAPGKPTWNGLVAASNGRISGGCKRCKQRLPGIR